MAVITYTVITNFLKQTSGCVFSLKQSFSDWVFHIEVFYGFPRNTIDLESRQSLIRNEPFLITLFVAHLPHNILPPHCSAVSSLVASKSITVDCITLGKSWGFSITKLPGISGLFSQTLH